DGGWVSTITASGTADRMASSEQMVDSPGRACVTGSGGGPATDSPSSVVSIMAPPATPRPAAVASGGTVRGYRVPGQPRDGGHLGESDVLSPEPAYPPRNRAVRRIGCPLGRLEHSVVTSEGASQGRPPCGDAK